MSHASAASSTSSKAAGFRMHQGRLHLQATSEPIAIRSAIAALERQPELAAPVKLVAIGAGEVALMAEIPRALAQAACEDLARRALEAGWHPIRPPRARRWVALCSETVRIWGSLILAPMWAQSPHA